MTSCVDLLVEEPAWLAALPDLADLAEQSAQLALAAAGLGPGAGPGSDAGSGQGPDAKPDAPGGEGFTISILACDDTRIAALNGDHRGKPRPTNVLSWPAFHLAPEAPGAVPPPLPAHPVPGPIPLGDVAIALQTCQSEADSAARPLKFHVTHLILHGCLHLLGYDHETPQDAALMEGLETRALTGAGLPDPYV